LLDSLLQERREKGVPVLDPTTEQGRTTDQQS